VVTSAPRQLRGRLLKGVAILFVVGLALFLAGAAYVISLPGVGDAEMRVHQILASHHGIYSSQPPPQKLGDAVVSVEDEHFYSNFLVNVVDGFGRAALATLDTSQDPGGSTIQQQLAKQLYGHGTDLLATFQEIGLGVKLSLSYSKPQILAMYLNAVYYGNGYWGDVAAARGYFGKSPAALNWAQAAMLAGLPQAPSAYDPLEHYALAKERQRHVLDQLVANHHLSRARANAAFRQPLELR
jgi:membrane peptidoglycan carboxypeptidase